MNTISNTGLYIDNACFGSGMILTAVKPYKEYQNGTATDNVLGYKYCVVLPARGYEMLEVKIAGEKRLDAAPGDNVPVVFDSLCVRPYVDRRSNMLAYTAQAGGIRRADSAKR